MTALVHPRDRLQRLTERLAALRQRLALAELHQRQHTRERLATLQAQLLRHNPRARLRERQLQSGHLRAALVRAMNRVTERHRDRLTRLRHTLATLSPLAPLARGSANLTDPLTKSLLRRSSDAQPGQRLRAQLAQGSLTCRVESKQDDA